MQVLAILKHLLLFWTILDHFQLAWLQLETQLSQNSAWAKATIAFIFMCHSYSFVSH